jgi:hypothetical protein
VSTLLATSILKVLVFALIALFQDPSSIVELHSLGFTVHTENFFNNYSDSFLENISLFINILWIPITIIIYKLLKKSNFYGKEWRP